MLHRQLDKWGRSFELIVNGIPVFAKGADVIPFDSFPNRVTTADYRRILESARDANMNMIRHWGGGYYETDEFYAICDELGIMVWQDFMFGNDWQPGTYAFKLNIEAEAEDQVRRLRNHPSIVVWCGNNETEEALNWGDAPELPADVKFQMWQDYLTEFSGILPAWWRGSTRRRPTGPVRRAPTMKLSQPTITAAMTTSGMCGTGACRSRPTRRTIRALSPSMASSRFRR